MQNASSLRVNVRDDVDVRASKYITGVYVQMMLGVMVTALTAYALVTTGIMMDIAVAGGSMVIWGIFILQMGTVMMFRPMAQTASPAKLQGLFYFYTLVTGVTVGYVGLIYTAASIMNVFAAAALAFGGLAAFGHVTKRSLGVVGTFCLQALWMTIGLSLLYAVSGMIPFLRPFAQTLNLTTGLLGVLVFSGLTAYESQRLKENAYTLAQGSIDERGLSAYTTSGALMMYLNFVNLFFSLLRLFGDRRR